QYAPLPVEKEVAVLYALTRGHVDDIAIEEISRFENEFVAYLDNEGKEVLEAILKEKVLTPEVEELIKKHIAAFKKSFAI
ncbi:MAG: F0F1 ATP synthase subunit alpha, partial [Candidatus Moraniibacteriota bacterium]